MTKRKSRWLLLGLLGLALAVVAYVIDQRSGWESYSRAGNAAYEQGNYVEAEKQWAAALTMVEGLEPKDPRFATFLNNFAALYYSQGKYAEAEPLYQRALVIWEKALGSDHPEVGTSLNNLAQL